MIARITGVVREKEVKSLIIEAGGIGYRVSVLKAVREAAVVGETVMLHIHHHVTSELQALYGFADAESLGYFTLLLSVPSVGPRTALNILDIAPPAVLASAVSTGDSKLLTAVSGVGRKTAERIVVELKGKLADLPTVHATGAVQQEALAALISIGFSTARARAALAQVPSDITSAEEAVRAALKTPT